MSRLSDFGACPLSYCFRLREVFYVPGGCSIQLGSAAVLRFPPDLLARWSCRNELVQKPARCFFSCLQMARQTFLEIRDN